MMDEWEKSDRPTVPTKSPNKAGQPAAEGMEGSDLAKRNLDQSNTLRMQGRVSVSNRLERVRQAAQRDSRMKFTALLHHVYALDMLREAYYDLKRDAAAGVDEETWQQYGQDLEGNLQDLSDRLKRGAYRALPVRRVYIPKADGRQRPLGVPVVEDKIVQRATVAVLNAIYETEFLGFSYGFRPGRSQHNALDALNVGLMKRQVNWVLDADIRGFFEAISHEWLVKFVEHRIGDRRVIRLIQKWLKAGALENGTWTQQEEGTQQGGSASPLLANVYLHYVFDLWVQRWRQRSANGEVIVVRFADDIIVGFQYRSEADRFLAAMRERLTKFGLEETFNFLGFSHICGKTRKGWFTVARQTERRRVQTKLKEVKAELRRRLHAPVPDVGQWLRSVVTGHYRYYGVPGNYTALAGFRDHISRLWHRALGRRSQKGHVTWERMARLTTRWLPPAHIYHPQPMARLGVTT